MILKNNISPQIVKTLSDKQLRQLCGEIRRFLIKSVSSTGGHLASNLGVVELTIALHKVFDSPDDKIVFDVGHQSYTHKILTGRFERFSTLRSAGGISGFPRRGESQHDAFIGGHSGISVSAALGIAEAMRLSGNPHKAIAVAGDGVFTDGGTFEGMNNAGRSYANLLVILNDNEMSISKNTGAIAAYLSHLRSSKKYHNAKSNVKNFLGKNRVGEAVAASVSATKKFVKDTVLYRNQGNAYGNFFENLGFKYYGIVDGHDLKELVEVLELAKLINEPCLIHIKTKKGKGYRPAELNSGEYHGIAGVTTETDATPVTVNTAAESKLEKSVTYSEVFGREIARLGEKDDSIVLISAAMKHATGCNFFNKKFPDRFYDGGIAEAHCATFAAGLASMGKIPVFAVYSTFSQRAFDRFLHDCAIENLHVVIAIDRAGVVGEDGETHQGLFDVAMFSMLPNFTVFSPCNSDELRECLHRALYEVKGAAVVRYPRGQALPAVGKTEKTGDFRLFEKNSKKLIITYGRLTHKALSVDSDVLQLVKIKPLPEKAADAAFKYNEIVFCEEGIQRGGIGEAFLFELIRLGWKGDYEIKAAKGFIPAGDVQSQLSEFF